MTKFITSVALLVLPLLEVSAQWSDSPQHPISIFPAEVNGNLSDVRIGSDGSVWAMVFHPAKVGENQDTGEPEMTYQYRVQRFDPAGVPQFEDEGLLISDYKNWSFAVTNDELLIDSDGNAIVVVSDCRNSAEQGKTYTAYKLSPAGEMLWGDEGVAVSNPLKPGELMVCMNMIELDDHSYVFAWMDMKNTSDESRVCMQRLDKDGKQLWNWDEVAFPADEITGYPYLVNSGDNTFILVYSRTASAIFYARKLDFDCENVWGKDVRIYRGGWGNIPLHTLLRVQSSGDGGALVSWTDDRSASGTELAYLSYITSEGTLAFASSSDEADARLSYDGLRCFNLDAVPASDGSGFYAVWRATDAQQVYQGMKMQKVSKTGELLWGDEAKTIEPLKHTTFGYASVQQAPDAGFCAFYEEYLSYDNQLCMAERFDSNGNYVWADVYKALSPDDSRVSALSTLPFADSSAWLCYFTLKQSEGNAESVTYMMTRLNADGVLGDPDSSVESHPLERKYLRFDRDNLYCGAPDGTKVYIYSSQGMLVKVCTLQAGTAECQLPAGLYVANVGSKSLSKVKQTHKIMVNNN